jgi:hypothetical protein
MRQRAGVNIEVWAEMFSHSIQVAMKYGSSKAREKEKAAESLESFAM